MVQTNISLLPMILFILYLGFVSRKGAKKRKDASGNPSWKLISQVFNKKNPFI